MHNAQQVLYNVQRFSNQRRVWSHISFKLHGDDYGLNSWFYLRPGGNSQTVNAWYGSNGRIDERFSVSDWLAD